MLVLIAFGIGALKMTEPRFQRPDYEAVAALIEREAHAGDVVVDAAAVSPGPLTGLDVALDPDSARIFRAGEPQENDHPFTIFDQVLPPAAVARRVAAAADGQRIFLVAQGVPTGIPGQPADEALTVTRGFPTSYRRVQSHTYPGVIPLDVRVFARRGPHPHRQA
jgi:hypothetical protein